MSGRATTAGSGPGSREAAKLLGKLLFVVRDGGVRERQDLGRGAVVAGQPEGLRLGIALREAEDVLEGGAAERVDRLGVVADDGHVLLDLRHAVDDLPLEAVRVLVFVDEDVVEGRAQLGRRRGDLVEELLPQKQQIVVVDGVGLTLALAIALEHRDDVGLELGEVGRVLGEHLSEGAAGVDREGVEIEQHVALGETALERRDLAVRRRGLEHLASVLGIEDREVGRQPEARAEPPQQSVADGMERPAGQPPRVDGEEHLDPAEHLAGRLVREGQQQDARGVVARLDQAGDAVDEGARLAGAGARNDQDRPAPGEDHVALLVVQLPVVVDAVRLEPRRCFEDVLALHAPQFRPGA